MVLRWRGKNGGCVRCFDVQGRAGIHSPFSIENLVAFIHDERRVKKTCVRKKLMLTFIFLMGDWISKKVNEWWLNRSALAVLMFCCCQPISRWIHSYLIARAAGQNNFHSFSRRRNFTLTALANCHSEAWRISRTLSTVGRKQFGSGEGGGGGGFGLSWDGFLIWWWRIDETSWMNRTVPCAHSRKHILGL